ncbi:MAG TPA: heme exporter protein CcmB [Gammaproteobacteria bacterium]|nr:heme exporter protein CcmB [Gammaproteobacteria bacterium]
MRGAFYAVFARDLRVAFRRWSELAYPVIFFAIVVALFPLALSPTAAQLRDIGTGVLWVALLLSSLLALDGLFRGDADDGTLEQLLMSPVAITVTVFAKLAAHALVTLLPLICLVPLSALSFNIPLAALPTLILALVLAAPTLSVLVALGAALTVSLRRGGAIVGLLVLPLTGPLLIFGTRATDLGINGEPTAAPLFLLAALAALALALGPLAIAAAVKVGLE